MQRRRSTMVCLGLTAVLATSLTGCGAGEDEGGGGDPEYTGICVDKTTGVRLDDAVCDADPLPDEQDFQAQSAVNAGSDPAVQPTDQGTAPLAPTTSPAPPSASGTTVPATSGTPVPGASGTTPAATSPAGAPIPTCVPASGAMSSAPTVTATMPLEASPTAPGAAPTTFEGACPPGQVPAGPGGAPAPVTTTVYRHSTSHGWFFIPWGLWAPPIGQRATYGSYAPPTGTTYSRGGMTRSGGTVTKSSVSGGKVSTSRGGFGGSGSKGGS